MMGTTVDIAQHLAARRSMSVVAQITPEAVLCPLRSAEAATFLSSLLIQTEGYRAQRLEVIYVVASVECADPWAARRGARVRAFLRFTLTLDDVVIDPAESVRRAQQDLDDRLARASAALYAYFTLTPVPASALRWALGAEACAQPLVGLRFTRRAPHGVSLAPPQIAPTLDYLVRRPGCAALTFRVERRSSPSTDETPLRFGVIALGEAAGDEALASLADELCGRGMLAMEPEYVAAPTLELLRPIAPTQRDHVCEYVTAPAPELPSALASAMNDDVTLTDSEAGSRLALPPLLFELS